MVAACLLIADTNAIPDLRNVDALLGGTHTPAVRGAALAVRPRPRLAGADVETHFRRPDGAALLHFSTTRTSQDATVYIGPSPPLVPSD